jgi:hypothetical protein
MAEGSTTLDVAFEVGAKRTFAGAVDWPGWCRSGRDEKAALESLLAYGPRYADVLRGTRLGFRRPGRRVDVRVTERLRGTATTDFGAPDAALAIDVQPVVDADLRRFGTILRACWRAFDGAVSAAEGVELRRGPRGGGRSLDGILEHVVGADAGYLSRLAWKLGDDDAGDRPGELVRARAAILDALAAAARGQVEAVGPRGGRRWPPRYFVRRVAWHVLDHAWEIEDRAS